MSIRRWLPKPTAWDGVLAGGVLIVEVFAATRDQVEVGPTALTALPVPAWVVLFVGSAALLWRRDRPLVVLAVVVGAYAAWHIPGYADAPSLAFFVAMYGVGRYIAELRTSLVALVASTAVIVATALLDGDPMADVAIAASVVPLLPWYVGRRVAARHEHLRLLEDRAALLERERAAELRIAIDEERRSIARELHDVVAHRVSLMTVQAGAAQAIIDTDGERAAEAMGNVEAAGRDALDELRHLLDVLGPRSGDQPRTPAASMADLERLRQEMEDAGLVVSLEVDGIPEDLPTRVDLSAFRIVQESLTNVLRHAGPGARATVQLGVVGDDLRIEVTDDGTGSSWTGGSGRGLTGMRERAELLGGRFEAGPADEGGFRVRAIIPAREVRS